ncbi:M20/M25/M40 family metallo-hydrolase [Nannocystis sp.]|uniref:M20/M25/M40 family metallo-hydrolase n=1 Tax=Nannocystis sp. TaxID=1962667 RepID=UPI0025EA352B|nr:M20/M25/M40 family metallo-hydrolase [Nannocystis sp.]MBK7825464.1 M20/M25/M40 family metallo-hydrolase [Nannocystis sp.]
MSPRVRIAALLTCVSAGALALLRAGPPAPRPADAPAHEFSALRAHARLALLLADEAPHPVGSAAGVALRGRLVAQLRELGLSPEELPAFSCSEYGSCAPVVNVLVRVPGQEPGPALLLASHYDSVPAGPGAADDGHGVALMLELLRAVLADGAPRRPLLAVFTDGEEAGLLGARAFALHPAFAEVGAVINLEARGTGGAARMFETSDGNAALIAAYAAGAARPSAHSLSYEVYRRLGNDTDLSVFKRAGAQGLGFAFIGGVRRYHTPQDDLAHLDLGSLQQQGDAALGTTRALLAAGITPPAGNATYADLFGLFLLRWPASLDLVLAGLALLLTVGAAWRGARSVPGDRSSASGAAVPGDRSSASGAAVPGDRSSASGAAVPGDRSSASGEAVPGDRLRPRALLAAAGSALLLGPLLGAGGAYAALWLVGVASQPVPLWPGSPTIALLAAAAGASVGAVFGLAWVADRVGARAQALGVWLVWSLLAIVAAALMPGASVLFIGPALLAGLALVCGRDGLASGLGGAMAWALWVPLIPALVDALGVNAWLIGALVGWTWGAVAATLIRVRSLLVSGLACAAAVAGLLAVRAPPFDLDAPGKLNILHVQDLDEGAARFVLDTPDGVPKDLSPGTAWQEGPSLPWSTRALSFTPAPAEAAEGPSFTATGSEARGELRRVTGTLRARPGARSLYLVIPAGALVSLEIGGRKLDPEQLRRGPDDARVVVIHGPPGDGVPMVAELRGAAAWTIADALTGTPASAAALVAARPPERVPYQQGDLRVFLRKITP